MPPQVITVSDLKHASGDIVVPIGTLITPSARDFAAASGITIRFAAVQPAPAALERSSNDTLKNLASRIDHTLLHPAASQADIAALCEEAREHSFHAVCIHPTHAGFAHRALAGSGVHTCAVIGFPSGAHQTSLKVTESSYCVDSGAGEIDMVANSGWLKDGRVREYAADIAAVRARIGENVTLKVIIEAALLTDEQIVAAAALAADSGANYIKTSTGVYSQARIQDIRLIRAAIPKTVRIKAAGGIRTLADTQLFLASGVDRLGTSNSVAIMWEKAGVASTRNA